jgi:hypothetical protein
MTYDQRWDKRCTTGTTNGAELVARQGHLTFLLYSTESVVSHIFCSIVIVLYPEEPVISSVLYHEDDVVLLLFGIHTLVHLTFLWSSRSLSLVICVLCFVNQFLSFRPFLAVILYVLQLTLLITYWYFCKRFV